VISFTSHALYPQKRASVNILKEDVFTPGPVSMDVEKRKYRFPRGIGTPKPFSL
jgi:hypothetical protein